MDQQIATFEVLYDIVDEGGVYLVEDLHTSYWTEFTGSATTTFVDRCKLLIDALHGWHHRRPDQGPSHFTRTATGLHFYDSVMVIEKCPVPSKPRVTKVGRDPFPRRKPAPQA